MAGSTQEATAQARADKLATLPFLRTDLGGTAVVHPTRSPDQGRGQERSDARRIISVWGFGRSISDIVRHRELLGLLVRRELKAKYKNSALGLLWTLARPLTMLLIYTVAAGKFLGAANVVPNYAIYVYSGLTIWSLFQEIVVTGTSSIVHSAGLIKKVYLPREVFPVASTGSAVVTFSFQFLVLALACVLLRAVPTGGDLVYIPLGIGIMVVWGLACALLLSAVNVYLRDVQYLVEAAIMLFMWASPIIYPWGKVVEACQVPGRGWLLWLMQGNPMTAAVMCFHRGVWQIGSHPTELHGNMVPATPYPDHFLAYVLVVIGVGLVAVFGAQQVFRRLQGNFAQEI